MKKYKLKSSKRIVPPDVKAMVEPWRNEPASPRQIKLLRFFEIPFSQNTTKGEANTHIYRIFATASQKERWDKYRFLSGDDDLDNPELKPFDPVGLEKLILPVDWREQMQENVRLKAIARLKNKVTETEPTETYPRGIGLIIDLTDAEELKSPNQSEDHTNP